MCSEGFFAYGFVFLFTKENIHSNILKRVFLFKEMVRFFGNRKWALGDKKPFGFLPKLVGLKNFFESPPISGTGFYKNHKNSIDSVFKTILDKAQNPNRDFG